MDVTWAYGHPGYSEECRVVVQVLQTKLWETGAGEGPGMRKGH